MYSLQKILMKHIGALYLPDSDAMLLYCAWCTDEELWMTTINPMMNIEDRPLMIVAGMTTKQQTVPFGRAFLPNKCRWVFYF
jgi:hypothetical protein